MREESRAYIVPASKDLLQLTIEMLGKDLLNFSIRSMNLFPSFFMTFNIYRRGRACPLLCILTFIGIDMEHMCPCGTYILLGSVTRTLPCSFNWQVPEGTYPIVWMIMLVEGISTILIIPICHVYHGTNG